MTRKSLICAVITLTALFLMTGCGGQAKTSTSAATSAAATVVETTAVQTEAKAETTKAETTKAETTKAETTAAKTEETKEIVVEEVPADGIYTAEFYTDSSMFHVNEACDGLGVLTVENGKMTLHVSLASKGILNLFVGMAEDAEKEGADLLEPTVDTVKYKDGLTDEVYGYDIPVPYLGAEFDCALIGKKGKWYDHKVSVSNPQPKAE